MSAISDRDESAATTTQQDARLLAYTRENIQPIVACIVAQAARCGEDRDWSGMNDYQTIAGQLSTLAGLGTAVGSGSGAHTATMTAGAGLR